MQHACQELATIHGPHKTKFTRVVMYLSLSLLTKWNALLSGLILCLSMYFTNEQLE